MLRGRPLKRYNVKTGTSWRIIAIVASLISGLPILCAAGDSNRDIPPTDYFVGRYEVIGRKPDSSDTYSGTIELRAKGATSFVMVRQIGGREIRGSAVLDHASPPADHPAVLRVRFSEDGHDYEGVFLWRSDFENSPRLTGYTFEMGKTKSSGMEAWFVGKR